MSGNGGYFVPQSFARDLRAAIDGWEDFAFLTVEMPTLLGYTSTRDLIAARRQL